MRHSIVKLVAMSLIGSLSASAPAFAEPAPEVYVAADQLAAGGYDVTTYFVDGKPMRGSPEYQTSYKGVTWRFASADNLARFQANPTAYEPQFGGYCAWAVSQGYVASGDPEQWKIVDGKLYLNYNARAKALWEADEAASIERGHANWPIVLTKNQNNQ